MGAAHSPEVIGRITALLADTVDVNAQVYRRCTIHHLPLTAGPVDYTGDLTLLCPMNHVALWWEVYDMKEDRVVAEGSRTRSRHEFDIAQLLHQELGCRSFARPAHGTARIGFVKSRYTEIERRAV